jgi:transglutaminase-like putative cysteine protease
MNPKSFFKMPNPLKISIGVAVAVMALTLACALPCRAGDTAPDWLRTAAQQNLPEYPKEAVAVVLLDEQQIVVKDNGEIDVRHRRALKILRPGRNDEYDYAVVPFDNQTKVSYFGAWTITATGQQIELKEKESSEAGLEDYEVFSDHRIKFIRFAEANVGSVVGYEYVQRQRPFVFEDEWYIQSEIPTRRARLTLQLPSGWEFSSRWANHPKQEPQSSSNNTYVWEVENIPGIEPEPGMPPYRVISSRMDLKYFPRDLNLRAKTTGSWDDIGSWYTGLTSASRVPSPEIQQKVAELTAGMTDPLAKMQALASYVQQNIRYVAIEVGIGGFQPHPAADVFKHQYGDCKDKATLMSTMLKVAGIDSYYVMIDTHRGIVNPDFPSIYGNHMVMAIRLPEGVPTNRLYGIVDDPKLGKLLFFDPTNSYVPLGYLPDHLQESYGLLVTPDGGKLVLLPLLAPATNRLLRTATLTLTPTGNLGGNVQELRWGGPAVSSRHELLSSTPADRAKVFEQLLGSSMSNFKLTGATVANLENYNETLNLQYKFVTDSYAKAAGDLLIIRPRVVGEKGSSILTGKDRKYPIEFSGTSLQSDVFDITLPPGYVVDELPKPVDAHCAYGSYKSNVEVKDNVLHYKRTYEITDVSVPTDKLPEVRDFFYQVAAAEKSSAVLRRSTPSSTSVSAPANHE